MDNNSQMRKQDDELVIDLGELMYVLLRKLPYILLVTIVTAAIGFIYSSMYLVPTYKTSTSMYVLNTQDENKTTQSDLQSSAMLSQDYAQMIKSRIVLKEVISRLELNMTPNALSREISIEMPGSDRIIVLSVEDVSPIRAVEIADTTREVAAEHIKNVMKLDEVTVVDYAELPTEKYGPNEKKYTMLGGMLGFVLMCGIFTLRFVLNDTIRSTDDIERRLGLSCLAMVPTDRNIKKRKKSKR